jgi:hypothetical protein
VGSGQSLDLQEIDFPRRRSKQHAGALCALAPPRNFALPPVDLQFDGQEGLPAR